MKILYDQQIFSFQDFGGISRYFYELIKGVKKTDNRVLVDGIFSNNIYLPKLKSNVVKILPQFTFPHKNLLIFYLNRLFGIGHLSRKDFDIFHATYFHPYFLNNLNGRPYIITVYDMVPELFAGDFKGMSKQTLEYKRKTICNADQVIAISENTKKDLINLYGISEEKIHVIYPGNPLEKAIPSKVRNLPKRYLLYVGNRSGYKNFTLFIEAVTPILKKDNTLFLVCAGGGMFSDEEKRLLSKLEIGNQVKQVGFKDDNELAYIYKKALVYVLPSLYEGFGMTALEAFSMGCPVVASNTSSIPEVCGKAAVYISPKNSVSIKSGIEKVMRDNKFRRDLARRGLSQVKKFNWKNNNKETLVIYKKCMNEAVYY